MLRINLGKSKTTTTKKEPNLMISRSPLHADDMEVGMSVYVTDYLAKILGADLTDTTGIEYKASKGLYRITGVEDGAVRFANAKFDDEIVRPYKLVAIHHEDWDEKSDHGLLLVYNSNSHLILAGYQLTAEEPLYAVFTELKQLTNANADRITCIACDQPLDIVFTSLRICKTCEAKLTKERDI